MLSTMIAIVFVTAYACIALEHPLKINKSASALIAAGLMWTLYSVVSPLGVHGVTEQLTEKLAETAAIVFFLISAMTIVEVTDSHGGFDVITCRINATKLSSLLWIIGFITFYLSSILDNMTSTIVMVALMKRMLKDHNQRLFFAGIIVISANAGGAWSPIGDVTTTMLWIGGQITTANIIKTTWLASTVNMLVPLVLASFFVKGAVVPPDKIEGEAGVCTTDFEKTFMFFMGMGSLLFVPVFKSVTHLPPYLGILLALGVLWLTGNILHRNKPEEEKEPLKLAKARKRIDMASVVFCIGLLLAVATLSANGMLPTLAGWLDEQIGNQGIIITIIGILSAVVDNIPLVAASMGMYPMAQFPADSFIWEFMAYCAGTGGSILIIGSAAGVAAMGLEKIEFFWYARRIGPLALAGYFAGIATYIIQYNMVH